jgi:tagaturonate reductase
MKRLTYEALKEIGYEGFLLPEGTERVLQLGEGNFLRAFVDYFIDVANEKTGWGTKVVVAQPIAPGLAGMLNEQEGLYTLYLRGMDNGEKREEKRVISSVSRAMNPYEDYKSFLAVARQPDIRYIVSNTTEAGIAFDPACKLDDEPPASFPGKLTRLLFERYKTMGKEDAPGFVILSCELIDNNGKELKRCVQEYIKLWKLDAAFAAWVEEKNLFCSTLVDRIVTGYPRDEAAALNEANGYQDNLLDTGEIFGFWVIEGPQWLAEELPFAKAGLPVLVTEDHTPYKKRKVRILNGAHTTMVPAAYLAGQDIVRACMEDSTIREFLNRAMQQEIIPTLTLPADELAAFASSVLDRFQNPFIDHALLSITLNTTAKWRARVLPSVKEYLGKTGKLPACLTFGFAATLAFFRATRMAEGKLYGERNGVEYAIMDDADILEFYFANKDAENRVYAETVCAKEDFWGENLNNLPGFTDAVVRWLDRADAVGMRVAMEECLDESGK